jgi:hypothetical protein
VQTGHVESPPHLPTLDTLDAEFRWEDKPRADWRRKNRVAQTDSTSGPTQPELPAQQAAAKSRVDATARSSLDPIVRRPSLGRRAARRLARFLVVFGIGVGATLAWQSYGDAARAMIANASPQLGWLAPQAAPVAQTIAQAAPETPVPAAALPDLQPLALGLASVRQSVDQLAAQLADAQRQTGGDIAKLQADEQKILHKLSAAPPRPAADPAHKPAPVTSTQPSPSAQPSASAQAR